MIHQLDNFFWYKLNALLRLFIVRGGYRNRWDDIRFDQLRLGVGGL